ncbi:uncharacterized protein C05D11.1-like [Lytechinus pictus]|uniref:uncharacterized protein C05D11.1-like n=1 Tax=Lytechinus pictus TaxID=7653 RepID=UPI0030BA0F85
MAASFEKICDVVSNGIVPVTKYRSTETGLTVCLAQVEGPLVNGYFVLATEAHDDDGLPHTLEHLIFLGSEEYPFKGVLDMLANRCLAQGTNAWTDTDHTCYTVMTAGSQGFINLMPIYLDHVLYPTLTDAGYITEVHHVNGEGENAGVVYCEMQGRENSGESRCHLAMLRKMYPGHCGYKSETGGIMANLRDSTSNEKVRNYHRDFYRPENLCLIITGKVAPEEVFKALEPFEQKIKAKGALPSHVRPWQSPVPPLPEKVVETVKYPSDDESNGMIYLAWRGACADDMYKMSALLILLEYLTDTSVAPLQRDFVELSDAYCSKVRYSIIEATASCLYLKFENVPKAKLGDINGRTFSLLNNLSNGTEDIDMVRMKSVIHRRILEALNNMEDNPHETFAFMCIGDFLYDNTEEELKQRLNQVDDFRRLQSEEKPFWCSLLKEYFVDPPSVMIIGEPSGAVAKDMADEEKQRVASQVAALGEEGLKTKADILEKAIEENEKEAPPELLTKLPIPDTGSIQFHPFQRYSNLQGGAGDTGLDLQSLPFTFQLDDIHTNFVKLSVLLDTSKLDATLKPYLPLYLELLFESPITRDGAVVSHEDVITQLAADTLATRSSLGIRGSRFRCGKFSQVASIVIKVEEEKYSKGVQWLQEILFQVQFTADRIKIVAQKMINDVAKLKRDGRTLALTVLRDINYSPESNHHVASMIRQQTFLNKLLDQLGQDPSTVIKNLNSLRDLLTSSSNVRIHMAANMKKLSNPQSPWQQYFIEKGVKAAEKSSEGPQLSLQLRDKTLSKPNGQIVGVGSVESAFFVATVPCVDSCAHPDLPAVMVYMECLCALEGPMWRQIRGLGFAYHYSMYIRPEEGLMYFQLYKCTHVVSAYKQAKEIVEGYLSGKTEFHPGQVETAISSVLYEIIEREETVASTSNESMMNYLRGVDQHYNRELLQKISKVTIEDLKRVGQKYFSLLFDPAKANCALCCQSSKVDEIKESFKAFNRNLTIMASLEEGLQ